MMVYSHEQRAKRLPADIGRLPRGSNEISPLLLDVLQRNEGQHGDKQKHMDH